MFSWDYGKELLVSKSKKYRQMHEPKSGIDFRRHLLQLYWMLEVKFTQYSSVRRMYCWEFLYSGWDVVFDLRFTLYVHTCFHWRLNSSAVGWEQNYTLCTWTCVVGYIYWLSGSAFEVQTRPIIAQSTGGEDSPAQFCEWDDSPSRGMRSGLNIEIQSLAENSSPSLTSTNAYGETNIQYLYYTHRILIPSHSLGTVGFVGKSQ